MGALIRPTHTARREKAAPARCPGGRGVRLACLSAALGPLGSSAACAPAVRAGLLGGAVARLAPPAAGRWPSGRPNLCGAPLRGPGPSALVGRRPRFKSRRACCVSSGGGGPRAGAAGPLGPCGARLAPRARPGSPPAAVVVAAWLPPPSRVVSGPPARRGFGAPGARRWPPAPRLVLVAAGSPLVFVPPGPLRPLSFFTRARTYPGPMTGGFPLASALVLVAAWEWDSAPPEAGQDRAGNARCARSVAFRVDAVLAFATVRPGSVRFQLRY